MNHDILKLVSKQQHTPKQSFLWVTLYRGEKFWKYLYLGADVCYKQQHTPKQCVHRANRESEEFEQHRKWAICG